MAKTKINKNQSTKFVWGIPKIRTTSPLAQIQVRSSGEVATGAVPMEGVRFVNYLIGSFDGYIQQAPNPCQEKNEAPRKK